jgi:hypothetical protein
MGCNFGATSHRPKEPQRLDEPGTWRNWRDQVRLDAGQSVCRHPRRSAGCLPTTEKSLVSRPFPNTTGINRPGLMPGRRLGRCVHRFC